MLQQLSALLYAGSLLATPVNGAGANPATSLPPAATIQRRVEEVRVSFSVEDRTGPLTNVSPDAFVVYDDTQAVSSYTSFSADSDLPLHIGLLIDRSDSVGKEFAAEKQAAETFLRAVLRPGIDSIFLLDFTHELRFRRPTLSGTQAFTAELSALTPGGQTALYDAVYAAAQYEVIASDDPHPVRRVILLLSDGEDNYSRHALQDAISAVQGKDISVFAITVHRTRGYHPGDQVLEELAEASGGRAFILRDLQHLEAVFLQIQDQIRTQYSVAFHPVGSAACGYHRLAIQPHDPTWRVHARRGYFACLH